MKTIATLIFVFLIGFTSQAQNADEAKVDTVEMTVVTNIEIKKKVEIGKYEVARLYKRDNARVKKELSFSTKRNKAKMA
ncbi:hypothetical protein D1013_15465 [Euzebyella marina]|uniref:Uncharacterized protein n=1 Tax=Euzebyella marina TaxID=1761453 RepID=A0A3G2LBX9_9FLAO|nr:hypothetical protein [Euzebyella marina]AYN69770.1 hypothetical protein D1013_15465 [Euzebyella marina]